MAKITISIGNPHSKWNPHSKENSFKAASEAASEEEEVVVSDESSSSEFLSSDPDEGQSDLEI